MKRETAAGSLLEIWDKCFGVVISGEQKERYGHNTAYLLPWQEQFLGYQRVSAGV